MEESTDLSIKIKCHKCEHVDDYTRDEYIITFERGYEDGADNVWVWIFFTCKLCHSKTDFVFYYHEYNQGV